VTKPNLFIVGAPKAGTTSLYGYLAGHPQIYMCPSKEPLYFSPDVRSGTNPHRLVYPRDEARYLELYAEAGGAKRLGEATTRYLVSRHAAELVKSFNPDSYAIAIVRNPVDVVHALHNERVSQGHESITDFAKALAADADRARGERLPPETNDLGSVYRLSAMYAAPITRWIDALGRERVHIVVFDDFVGDTPAEFRRVLEFLGVEPDYQPAAFAAHNASHRQRRWVRQVMDSRAGNYLTHDVLTRVIGPSQRARLALRFRQSRLNRRPAPRSPIPAELRRQLEADFHDDVVETGAMVGRDLVSLWFGSSASNS
jgi:hypothetical protein